jgi:hypothetical protein
MISARIPNTHLGYSAHLFPHAPLVHAWVKEVMNPISVGPLVCVGNCRKAHASMVPVIASLLHQHSEWYNQNRNTSPAAIL